MASFKNWTVDRFTWSKKNDDLYRIENDFTIMFQDEENHTYIFLIKKGALTDGGSIPKAFSWFAKGWYDDNFIINACYILHDALYASELMPKDIADDILRSSLRDCGFDRLHASTICWAVNTFAKRHYGKSHDRFDLREYVERIA